MNFICSLRKLNYERHKAYYISYMAHLICENQLRTIVQVQIGFAYEVDRDPSLFDF